MQYRSAILNGVPGSAATFTILSDGNIVDGLPPAIIVSVGFLRVLRSGNSIRYLGVVVRRLCRVDCFGVGLLDVSRCRWCVYGCVCLRTYVSVRIRVFRFWTIAVCVYVCLCGACYVG